MSIMHWMRINIFRTFRGRLALLYIALELSILLFAAVVLYYALSHRIYQEVDEQLMHQAGSMANELEGSPFYFWSGLLNRYADHYQGPVQLISANGLVLFNTSASLINKGGNDVSRALAHTFRTGTLAFASSTNSLLNKSNIRVIAFPIHKGGRITATLLLGHSTSDIRSVFNILYVVGGILGLISIIISAVAGYYMAKRALEPIQEITSTARGVAAGDLSRRLKSKSQDKELQILVRVLNKMFTDLEASFKSQKRFTADASHELRLPLTILKGEIEVALRHPRTTEEYQQILQQQLGTIDRIQRIVNDLLTLARAEAGQLELVQASVDLSLLLQEIGQQHLILFDSQKIHLEMHIENGLMMIGEADQIERTIMNLLSNAFKHAPEQSSILLSAIAEGESALICIRDEGPGIAEQQQQRLFDRFYRADDARCRKDGDGAGLGLAICKRIIDAHGGKIWVESDIGAGTSFWIRLPLSSNALNQNHQERLNNILIDT